MRCDSQAVKRLLIVLFAVAGIVAGLGSGRLLRRHVVDGRSMLRAFAPGDKVLVEGVSYRLRSPRIGEVVLVRLPGAGGHVDLRRIAAGPGAEVTVSGQPDFLGHDEWYVLGDNLDESTDSRQLGPVKADDIIGRVWQRS